MNGYYSNCVFYGVEYVTSWHHCNAVFFTHQRLFIVMNNTPKISIAIVDDHHIFREGIASLLSKITDLDIAILAQNGKDLIAQFNEAQELPDVCLLDISMPVMNGYETLDYLNQNYPDVKVLAFSMYTDEFPVISMMAKGACGFVPKTVSPDELVDVIKYVQQHGYYYHGLAAEYLPRGLTHIPQKVIDISEKEMKFLQLCCTTMLYTEIAAEMNVSSRTTENYRNSLFKKLNTNNRIGLAIFAIRAGLLVNVDYANI